MITEVATDIYKLTVTLSDPMGSVHCYLIAGEEDCVLVDTGPDSHQTVDLVTEAIRESGLDPAADPLGTVLLTRRPSRPCWRSVPSPRAIRIRGPRPSLRGTLS